jgi:hypothetical protein
VILVEHDDVIDDFSLARSHPAFGRSVLPGTLKGRALWSCAKALDCLSDVVGEGRVVVERLRSSWTPISEECDVRGGGDEQEQTKQGGFAGLKDRLNHFGVLDER